MKKISLIACVVFFALFSNKTNGQTIDNIITDTINCPGGSAGIQVNILNPANITYNVVLQKIDVSCVIPSWRVL
jgi:hypothetical protein